MEMDIDSGTELTCTNEDCDCSFLVQRPCTQGSKQYRCACGAPLVAAAEVPAKSGSVVSREIQDLGTAPEAAPA